MEEKKRITSFRDLTVYQDSYKSMTTVMQKILPCLPKCEEDDLLSFVNPKDATKLNIRPFLFDDEKNNLSLERKRPIIDQLRRASKAIPRLIAEGYAKRHQKAGFQKYLDDAMAESNEMIVSLSQSRDIYPQNVDIKLCDELIDAYDKSGRQIYKLAEAWSNFEKTDNRYR